MGPQQVLPLTQSGPESNGNEGLGYTSDLQNWQLTIKGGLGYSFLVYTVLSQLYF